MQPLSRFFCALCESAQVVYILRESGREKIYRRTFLSPPVNTCSLRAISLHCQNCAIVLFSTAVTKVGLWIPLL